MSKRKKTIFKKISIINGLLLIAQISFSGLFFIMPSAAKEAQAASGGLCSQAVDTVLILDRSGSMDYTSRCDWWQLKCNNPSSCSTGYTWTQNITYDQSQSQCADKNQSAPHQSVYLAINPKKIIAAKQAANSFLALMGTGDQSALVSYANTATLDKALSNNHATTETAVNGLTAAAATNIGDAIKLAVDELKSARVNQQAIKNMILLTDGLANKPNGTGTGENPADVAYAESQAALAAASGYKIFTIGLGENGEINETMLQNIANATGADYYHSPAQDDLEAIYNSIATRLCQYGSITGCKYSDVNKDGNISSEEKLAGWEIKLSNNNNYTQLTDANGCYQFSGLLPGTYTLSEGAKAGVVFEQTYPQGGSYVINLAEGENLENKDFGNYLPVCGNSLVDANYGETCEIGQTESCTTDSGYDGRRGCRQDCGGWEACVASEYCGDGQVNNGEQCDGLAGVSEHYSCTASCALEYKPYCGDNIVNQSSEQCDGGSVICTTADGYQGTRQCNGSCGLGQCVSIEQCGDGLINGVEICDDNGRNGQYGYCNNDCTGQTPSICGNGAKEGAEECDGQAGLGQHQSCSDTCAIINLSYCGDGIKNGAEQCDDGNTVSDDSCSAICTIENNGGGGTNSCKISGYKLEDIDGLASTTADRGGLTGWTINLFGYEASTTPKSTATTTADGYFEFAGLLPGDYFLTENLTNGWAQLAAPEPLLNLDLASSSNLTDKNFINYKTDNKLTTLFDARDENNVIEIARPIYGRIISASAEAQGSNLLVSKLETFAFMADDQNTAGLVIELQPGAKTSLLNAIASTSAGAVLLFSFADGSATSTLPYDNWRYGLGGDNLYVFLNPDKALAKNLTANLPYTFELTIVDYAAVFGSSDPAAIIKRIRGMQGIGKTTPPPATSPVGGGTVIIYTPVVGGAVILPQNTVGQNGGLTVRPALTTPLVLGISGAPRLTIKKSIAKNKKTSLDFYAPGDKNIEYKITVNNNGELTAVNAALNDDLPFGLTYSDGGQTKKIWNLGDIKSGETKNINYTVNLAVDLAMGKYTNTATVKADNHAPVTAKADLNVKEAKIAGAKLAGTGFKFSEFIILLLALLLLLTLIAIIKMKYLKAKDPNKNLLKNY